MNKNKSQKNLVKMNNRKKTKRKNIDFYDFVFVHVFCYQNLTYLYTDLSLRKLNYDLN